MSSSLLDPGSGGGGDSPDPNTADDYIGDESVRWRALVAGIFGTGVTLVGIYVVEVIGLVGSAVSGVLSLLSNGYALLAEGMFEGATGPVWTAFASAEPFVTSLGPLAFPAAVGLSATTLLIILWGVSRIVG